MASRSFVQVVAVCLGMFSFVVGGISLRRKLLPSATDALYDCYVKQNCDCKIHERFEDCWDKLTQASRDFMIDELNKCDNVATLEYGTLKSWTDQLCPLEDSIRKPCYESVNTKMMERVIQAGIGLLGIDEVVAFEMTRKCIEPIMAYCSTFQDCMRCQEKLKEILQYLLAFIVKNDVINLRYFRKLINCFSISDLKKDSTRRK